MRSDDCTGRSRRRECVRRPPIPVELPFKDLPVRKKDYIEIKERADVYLDEWLTKKYFPSEWGRTHYEKAQAERATPVYPAH